MSELLTLTDAIVPPTRTTYAFKSLYLDWPNQAIQVVVTGSDGIDIGAQWFGQEALTLMRFLNTVDLSVVSLQKRVLQKLVIDGRLPPGTVTGEPDA